ncbi:MAG: hypothetical protein AAGI53_01660 [Planctomycetota bacterium]
MSSLPIQPGTSSGPVAPVESSALVAGYARPAHETLVAQTLTAVAAASGVPSIVRPRGCDPRSADVGVVVLVMVDPGDQQTRPRPAGVGAAAQAAGRLADIPEWTVSLSLDQGATEAEVHVGATLEFPRAALGLDPNEQAPTVWLEVKERRRDVGGWVLGCKRTRVQGDVL